MYRTVAVTFLLLFGAQSVSYGGMINVSPNASGVLALDETVAGGDSSTTDNFPAGEAPVFALDGDITTKYLQFAGPDMTAFNTGLIVFFDQPVAVEGIRFGFANDAPERDPWFYTIEGSNAVNQATYGVPPAMIADAPAWTPIETSGTAMTGLVDVPDTFFDVFAARGTFSDEPPFNRPADPFTNATAYSAYRILFPNTRIDVGIMQVAEIQLMAVPEPTSLGLIVISLACLIGVRRRNGR